MPIPKGIRRPHVLAAVEDFRSGLEHGFGPSTRYDLVFEGDRFPPKAIVGLAARHAVGKPLGPRDFKGGEESGCFRLLRGLGFDVEPKEVAEWDLKPGQEIKRTELHQRFGGRRQGGIAPSSLSPNVMIFTAASSGEQWGYVDEWVDDDTFHYTGEGQRGDMQVVQGNRAILDHRADGRALRLFEGARGVVTYVGEMGVDEAEPFHRAEAPEKGSDTVREVIVFHLRRVDATRSSRLADRSGESARMSVTLIPPENNEVELFTQTASREPREADRREARLVAGYREFLAAQGVEVVRQRISPPGESSLLTDLYLPQEDLLIEAKGSVTRESVRLAIGQLLDYRRFLPSVPRLAVLLPQQPRHDLVELLGSLGIMLIFPSSGGYERVLGSAKGPPENGARA